MDKNQTQIEQLENILKVIGEGANLYDSVQAEAELRKLLGTIQNIEQLAPYIYNALGNPQISYNVAAALGRLGDITLPLLAKAAKSANETLRIAACDGLGLNFSSNREMLLLILGEALSDRVGEVRQAALAALHYFRPYFQLDSKIIPQLIILMQHDPQSDNRYRAADLLVGIAESRVVESAIQALKDENERVRLVALKILAEAGDKQVLKLINQIITSENEKSFVRGVAVGALARLGGSEIINYLTSLLKNESADVRYAAVTELGKIGSEDVVPLLEYIYWFDKGIADYSTATTPPTLKNAAEEAVLNIRKRTQSRKKL